MATFTKTWDGRTVSDTRKQVRLPDSKPTPETATPPLKYACADRLPWRTYGTPHPVHAVPKARGGLRYIDTVTGKPVKYYQSTAQLSRSAKFKVYHNARQILNRAREHRLTELDYDRVVVLLSDPFVQQDYELYSALQRMMFPTRTLAGTQLTHRRRR